METIKGYLVTYKRFDGCDDEWIHEPFLVLLDEDSTKQELKRLNEWINNTNKNLPKIWAYENHDMEFECWEEAEVLREEALKKIDYPYPVLKNCFSSSEPEIKGFLNYCEIPIQK